MTERLHTAACVRTRAPHQRAGARAGGQYDCGTTDVTRTFHMGEPTAHQRECFTRVLQARPRPRPACGRAYAGRRSPPCTACTRPAPHALAQHRMR